MYRLIQVISKCLPVIPALVLTCLSYLPLPVMAQIPGPVNLQGTGGTITTQANDIIHTFTAGGTFTPPPGVTQVQVLVVGGGGGGGSSFPFGTAGSGGGGAGGLVFNGAFPVGGAVAVTVGPGGVGGDDPGAHEFGANGGNSTFGTITVLGGGGGAGGNAQGAAGGSGGGSRGANGGVANQPGSPSGGFGNRGGNFPGSPGGAGASGGGGAGGAGQDLPGNANSPSGNGGIGLQYSISGTATYYAGGGGGGNVDNFAVGAGGMGGGGAGANDNINSTPGTANRGGGGGGGNDDRVGAAGGSGIVIVRYTAPTLTLTQEPSANATTTVPFTQQPVVRLLNGAGNPVSGINITASIASGSGTIGGTVTVATNGSGLANFTNLSITGSGSHTISFTPAGSSQSVVSIVVNVVPPAISMVQQPSANATSTVPFTQQPVVQLLYNGSPAVGVNITASIETGSGTLGGTVTIPTNGSGQAVFTNLVITGLGDHTLNFSPAGFSEEVISSVISVGLPFTKGCPGYDGTSSPVVFKSCTEAKVAGPNISQSITIAIPPGVVEGDLLVAAIAIDESHLVNTTPAGWVLVFQNNAGGGGQAASFNVFYKFATASEPPNYTFTDVPIGTGAGSTPVQAAKYGWIMHFTGVSGIVASTNTTNGGQTTPAIAPSVTSLSDNNMILVMGGFDDRDIVELNGVDVEPLMTTNPAYTTITMEDSHDDGPGNNGTSVSGGAAYLIQSSPGASGAQNFLPFSGGERWVTVSMALEPLPTQFRISHAGTTTNCAAPINVTIRATDDSDNPITTYTGTINLSTNTGFGTWGIGSGNGVLTPGGLNPQGVDDGTASYTFDPADGGVVTLTFSSPLAGLHNFNIVDAGHPGIVESVDPDLNVAFCPTYEFTISNSGPTDTCTPATVNFRVAQTGGGPTLFGYTGTISISNDITSGLWAPGTANGTLVSGPDDGTADYTFVSSDFSVAPLSFYSTVADPTVNFDVTDGSFSEAGVDNELNISSCASPVPSVFDFQCENNSDGTLTVNIEAQVNNSNRLVVLTFSAEGDPVGGAGATTATFDVGGLNTAMTQLAQSYIDDGGNDALAEIWGVPDAGLPVAGGTYTATHANADTTRAMCLISLIDAEQNFPLTGVTAPNGGGGVVNINYEADSGVGGVPSPADNLINTSITVADDNSYVVSVVENGSNGPYATLGLAGQVFGNFNLGGTGAGFGSAGNAQNAGALNVQDDAGVNANRQAQAVAAFSPAPFTASQFSISHNNIGGTCTANVVTISAINQAGQVDPNYTGTITLSTTSGLGDWTDVSGTNPVNNGTANDGLATYSFDPADNGVVVLGFTQTSAGTVNFDITDGSLSESPFFDNDLVIGNCAFRVSNVGNAYTCSQEAITITAVDGTGNTLTAFTGTVNLTTSTGNGTWSIGAGTGVINDPTPDDGAATYTFALADNGSVTLDFHDVTLETVNINVTDGTYMEDPLFDPDITVLNTCEFRISHGGNGDTCSPQPITIEVYDGDGNPGDVFTGTINLSTSTGNGTWTVNTGAGILNDPGSDDGLATYTFDAADAGIVVLNFSDIHAETINFNLAGGGFSVNPSFDPDMMITDCAFRITFTGGNTSDVCSLKTVTIAAVDGTGATLTSYVGTINLSTDTGHGTWTLDTGMGTFNDPFAEDGNASYTFAAGDMGVVVFEFRDVNNETVNIDVTDGAVVENALFDPDLTVSDCTFRITHGGTMSACTSDTVTIAVFDSGGAPATEFIGTVSLNTSTGNGNWVSTTGGGTLTDVNPNDGVGSYDFVLGDMGTVDISFTDETAEIVSLDLDFNGSVEDPAFDPDLEVTQCVPTVSDVACFTNQSQASAITLPSSSASGGSRMVLLYTSSESLTAATGATINGVPMMELRNETANFGIGHVLQVYGLLDASLPAPAGSYDAAFTGSANSPAMCIVAVEGVKQNFPNDTGSSTGQINGSNAQNTQVASTAITTADNNSLVISVVANGQDGTTYTSTLANSLWVTGVADAASSDWAGNSDFQPTAGLVTVNETNSATPNRHAHIVLSLSPIITGPPIVSGYVPVTLFQTFAGNLNYRATGSSLRNQPNSVNACSFVPTATGTTRDLNIPAGSNIVAGYLYWAGSGTQAQEDSTVTFGPNGSEISISADDMYNIDNPYGLGLEFFAGYKDVTPLISTAATTTYHLADLSVQTGAPWSTYQGCLGGWGLVVVYQNVLENLNVINVFQGFQPFRYSSFVLFPGNFRMAMPDGVNIPNGQITHISFEGDDSLNQPGELLELQNDPMNLTFTALVNSANPALSQGGSEDAQYNDTITYPAYDGNLDFDPSGGDDGMGYFIDSTSNYGTDVDTYYMQGAVPGEILYPFGNAESEQIATRYGSGQDGVLLEAEIVAITNGPIADMEVFISEGGSFKVGSLGTGMYSYTVTNNGNGAVSMGYADGDVILTINLPVGMTAAAVTAPGWTCTPDVGLPLATAFTCIFEIANDWTTGLGAVTNFQLAGGEFLPSVDVTVNLDDESSFPLLINPVTQSARIAHVGDYTTCDVVPVGVQPDPTICSKAPQFDNVNDLNTYTIDIDDLDEKTANNNNVVQQMTNVLGIETDLSIAKSVLGVLEENQPAQYLLTVTNNGPDVTTKTMTVTDTLPAGLVPNTAGGTDWTCNIVSQDITCTRSVPLGVSVNSDITITTVSVVSPAIEGAFVSNTGVVQSGTYNFDLVPGNNTDTDITQVVGAPVASNEKFLISVNESSSIGGLGPFGDGDLVIYDPVLDTATMFLAESSIPGGTSLNNVNALHLLPNGQVLLSSDTDGSSIAGVGFDEGDIVLYDPILETATLVFDGSTVFTGAAGIDAINVNYNDSYDVNDWDIVLSTVDDSVINAVTYDDNDLILYDVSAGTASLLVDGASGDVFNGGNGDIDAVYIRYNDANRYTLSTDDPGNTTIGISGIQDTYTQDDLVEIDLTTPGSPNAGNVFLGDVANGIFTPPSGTRKLDAVHVIEDGYFGHFAIVSGGIGDTCSATSITIRKHLGLTHDTDTNYVGSVIISNDIGEGTWAKDVTANGTITDMGGGVAVYTFDPADNGEVILFLTQTNAITLNVDVTNGFRSEDAVEDNDIVISDVVTNVSYKDEFGLVAYSNNDGIASFASNWIENNDDGNPSTGAVRIIGGKLNMTNPGGSTFPEIQRTIDFSGYTPNTATNPLTLNFTWNRSNGAPADTFLVQTRSQDTDPWTTLQTINGFTGLVAATPVSIDMTAAGISPTVTTQIKFVLSAGYQLESFNLDDIEVTTATNDCNIGGALNHYSITHSGFGISCLAENITITPHTIADLATVPGAGVMLTLSTSTGKGSWGPPLNGTGPFNTVPGLGQATYVYQIGESDITFPFNYTNPVTDPESVSINVVDNIVPIHSEIEDPTLDVSTAGLRFFNDSTSTETYPTLVAGMNSLLYTGQILTLQAIQASDDNPAVCEDIFGPGQDVQVELAFECMDPSVCSAAVIPVAVTNNGNTTGIEPVDNNGGAGANPGGYDPVTLRFETFANGDYDQDPGPGTNFTYTGAQISLNYADAGSLQIHGRYNIPLLDGASAQTGNYMQGSGGNNFVVRPFGYDVDVLVMGMPDRQTNGNDTDADSWAMDANGSAFFTAGSGFDTTVRAISWQAADDDGSTGGVANDGIPDPGADLFDNAPTPNYGNETDPAQNDMTVTHVLDASMPVGAVAGTLSTNAFSTFGANNGSETHSMAWDEVGIIDLSATLDSGDYLGSGEGITGEILNLGRFVPADFEVSLTNLIERPLFTPSASPFTYMGEEFTAEFTLTVRNAVGNTIQNYIDDFAKLDTPAELSFFAVEDVGSMGDDVDYSSRLQVSMANGFPADFSGNWMAGLASLSGNLIFNRQSGDAPEAPITSLQIAMTALDDDNVIDTGRNVDDDDGITEPGMSLYNLIGTQEFRYGRLRLENAYGSEIPEESEDAEDLVVTGEDLPIHIFAEYYDGNGFVVNTDDVATPYDSSDLSFVAGSYTDNLNNGEAAIVSLNGVLYQGRTEEQNVTDKPLYLTAPGEGNDGTAVIELDLNASGLPFLFYDWRGVGDIEDENEDGDYTDNPRALIEFGTYLLHSRIINWQELFTIP